MKKLSSKIPNGIIISAILFSFCMVNLCHAALSVAVSDNGPNIGRYDIYEITMAHSAAYANPWQDVTITAVFTSPTGTTKTVGGFYYDTGIWKLRFAPMEVGTWTWTLTFANGSDSYTANGNFLCVSSNNPGFIRVNPANPYRLITEGDNKPFNPVALCTGISDRNRNDVLDNDFALNGGETRNTTLQELFSAFTRVGTNLWRINSYTDSWNGSVYSNYRSWLPTYIAGKTAYDTVVGMECDQLVQEMHKNKIHPWMVIDVRESYSNTTNQELAKYVINRWGAYVSIWELYNENSAAPASWYAQICPFIKDTDPYTHPITESGPSSTAVGTDSKGRYFIDITTPHWYPSYSRGLNLSIKSTNNSWKSSFPNKPLMYGEYGGISNRTYEPREYSTSQWTMFFDQAIPLFWSFMERPDASGGFIYSGVIEKGMARIFTNFFSDFDATAVPVMPALTPSSYYFNAYALRGSREIGAYFNYSNTTPVVVSGATVVLDIPAISGMEAIWIDPVTGNIIQNYPVNAGTQTLTIPDFSRDIVLRVKQNDYAKSTLQFQACNYYGSQDDGNIVVSVRRSGNSAGAVSVNYATGDDDAKNNIDYTAVSGVLNWGNGDMSVKTINIPIINRSDTEMFDDRAFHIALSNPTGGAVIGDSKMAIIGIINKASAGTPPSVLNVTPSSGSNASATVVNIAGSGFFNGTPYPRTVGLKLNDPANTQITSYEAASDGSIINAVIPAGVSAGTWDVKVITYIGGTNAASAVKFTVNPQSNTTPPAAPIGLSVN